MFVILPFRQESVAVTTFDSISIFCGIVPVPFSLRHDEFKVLDVSCSVSIVCNDLIALGNVTTLLYMVKLKLTTLLSASQTRARLAEWSSPAAASWNFCVQILHLKV